jgi:radical SAM superfamily enzyme YgiQ (UPF0313 family)
MNHYSDEELRLIRKSGCCLVFMGAETGNDQMLPTINKGTTFTVKGTYEIVTRFRKLDIIPELSFVLGFPDDNPEKIMEHIRTDIQFIRDLKKLNPATEMIIYIFSPVPSEGSSLFDLLQKYGLKFPSSLDEWLAPEWEKFDLRGGAGIPWLSKSIVRYIRNFEVVMMAAYPSISNSHIGWFGKRILNIPGKIRYRFKWYRFPFEVKALLKLFSYQRPEKEGFYSE